LLEKGERERERERELASNGSSRLDKISAKKCQVSIFHSIKKKYGLKKV